MPIRALVEALETRRHLTGVTLITHGLQFDGVFPQWVTRMAESVDRRLEPDSAAGWMNVSRYRLRIVQSGSDPVVESFARLNGPLPASSTTGEAVIELDWSAASGLSGPPTSAVATAALGALSSPAAALGFGSRGILGMPLHLIGHSRGASLVADLARQIGTLGVSVDHLTTLDPFPIGADPGPTGSVNVPDNVIFADNYYQRTDSFIRGNVVSGAYNIGPLNLPGGASSAHSDVHTYYHATIDRGDPTDGDVGINPDWFTSLNARATTGYDFSRASGGVRPVAGVGAVGGGAASRVHVDTTISPPWPNAQFVSLAGGVDGLVRPGDSISLTSRYQTQTASTEIDYYLDTDRNVSNGFARTFGFSSAVASTGPAPATLFATATLAAPPTSGPGAVVPGVYYLNAVITDGTGQVRHFSAPQPLVFTPDGFRVMTRQWSRDTDANDAADPRNYSPGGVPSAADSLLQTFGLIQADVALPLKSLSLAGTAIFNSSVSQTISSLAIVGSASFNLQAHGSRVLLTRMLSLGSAARLNLDDNTVILDYASVSPLEMVDALVTSGYANGAWDGNGIRSGIAVHPHRTVGFAESTRIADSFPVMIAGVSVDSTAIVIRYTIRGDANLDRAVDFDDLLTVAQSYGQPGRTFADGDMDFDNDTDFDDLLALAQQYATTISTSAALDPAIHGRRPRGNLARSAEDGSSVKTQ